ncbi:MULTISPECIES: FKBP-type peptidyl-prolyl cis-trans isomerase [unclassified Pseudomonas]|uniref:FKBP-type peptidyl-prolyl cis-trans isomerase n=1 Tax=unclassified Pseudomonas TaxID=196821 RepID=UPI000BD07FD0|nr:MULTISPECIES: FKBP-type peptidyl-prolyl cis-trans isomerase [unclassified Pseudomonas]PVZ10410.1 FKBP-type peptidyl-prolyl cis-trans isomerase FklB [Pseudomonas sp. URIL14HWK12:I12]PVZ21836.1 FKBP-type peptidyl-prolyl cis-trans isomerase FklB [Pseudomonas sp. URIL14HWK12:I10]PVZ31081.1 FKBP-type peptidyl-prolyl cis-trans isomerase FklB [Pseudomonas sp. URIL14HWK12:I11]SNZ17714.1 FKBP-type peptidyl-prolyl cis-trans isomerase FklB [Pseudomonas sp. URIL14HWK12:I9]
MQRCLSLILCLGSVQAFAQDAPAPSSHDLAYSVGASLGERLRQDMPGLDMDTLVQALRQSYDQQPLALSEERMRKVLADHDSQASAPQGSEVEAAMAAERRFMANERAKAGVRELEGGVLVTELAPGNGGKPSAGSKVQVRYVGRLPDGTVFDQSDTAQWFRLGSVIDGWKTALLQMPKGAKWRVVVPSAQAYGADGAGSLIPPYTPLSFEIELLDFAQ